MTAALDAGPRPVRVPVDDLLDREGVARLLGVRPNTVTTYIRLYADTKAPTPDPIAVAGQSKLYRGADWTRWDAKRRRPAGRPRKGKTCPDTAQHGQKPCPRCGRRHTSRPADQGEP